MIETVPSVPAENLAIFRLLYAIEVGLRELIIELLGTNFGPRWWKSRLPPDVLEAFRDGRSYERSIPWIHLVPHHPLYYLDFPHLRKIIIRSDNWREVFQHIFPSKDALVGTLADLEPIRNKIAHNRKTTPADLVIVQGAYLKVADAVGREKFLKLVGNCTFALDIRETLVRLRSEADGAHKTSQGLKPLKNLPVWAITQAAWWFDPDYLGQPTDAIAAYFQTVLAYASFPRLRGRGHQLERWLGETNLDGKYAAAVQQLSAILAEPQGGS